MAPEGRLALAPRLWELATAPSREVERPEARRRARTLAAVLLFLMLAAALLTWVVPWLVAPAEHAANGTLAWTGVFSVGIGAMIYALARSRHFEAAAVLMVVTTMAACALSMVVSRDSVWADDAPYFLSLSVILSSILLPLSVTFLVIAANLLVLAGLAVFLPAVGGIDVSNAVAFLGFISVLLLVASYVRQLDLRQIRDQADALAVSEERYRSLFEATFEGIALHDDGVIIDTNEALARMTGRPREALLGMSVADLVVAEARPHIRQKVVTSAHETNEAVAERADGTTFPVEFVSKPYVHGGLLVRATAFRDVTERKEAEAAREKSRELAAANRRLQEIDRMKTYILNTASHELNTPITPLRLQVHLLREGRLGTMNEKQSRAVDILHRNLDRLHHLVQEMLDVSILQSDGMVLAKQRMELGALVHDVVAAHGPRADERHVALHLDGDGEMWIDGDAARMRQVLENLVQNALKYTPPEGRVDVEARRHGDEAVIVVRDTGLGLTPEQKSRLFQPFGNVHATLHSTERSAGLGLYIVKGIVDRHGGTVAVESAGAGRGSTFSLRLPLAR